MLTVLAKAVDAYHAEYGAYPPSGRTGLDAAIDLLSRKADYLPDGTPFDAWGRPYRYIPAAEYETAETGALRRGEGFCRPETYQLYSTGADGRTGANDISGRADNITCWQPEKPWRAVYHEAHEQAKNGVHP